MENKYGIDCHIGLEDGSHNVLRANGGHQVALSVWYKVISDETGESAVRNQAQENARISLFNVETGLPLEVDGGWRWSMEEVCTFPLERRESERGSQPADEAGYAKKKVYLTHTEDWEKDGAVLVGVQISSFDPESYGLVTGRSVHGVRVHRLPRTTFNWTDFTVTGPVIVHGSVDEDADYHWDADSDYGNLWRAVNFTITFKSPSKAVTSVEYSNDNYSGVYSTRRRNLYEVSGYVWPPNIQGESQEETLRIWFANGYQDKTIRFNPGKGFVITLLCFVKASAYPLEDFDGNMYSNKVIVYDEETSATTLYLDQRIPYLWTRILGNVDESGKPFSPHILSDVDTPRLPAKTVKETKIINSQYGYADPNCEKGQYLLTNDGFSEDRKGKFLVSYVSDAVNVKIQGYLCEGPWMDVTVQTTEDHDHDVHVISWDSYAPFYLYPKWDHDGFCLSVWAFKFGRRSVKAGEDSNNHNWYASAWNETRERYIWTFRPYYD